MLSRRDRLLATLPEDQLRQNPTVTTTAWRGAEYVPLRRNKQDRAGTLKPPPVAARCRDVSGYAITRPAVLTIPVQLLTIPVQL